MLYVMTARIKTQIIVVQQIIDSDFGLVRGRTAHGPSCPSCLEQIQSLFGGLLQLILAPSCRRSTRQIQVLRLPRLLDLTELSTSFLLFQSTLFESVVVDTDKC